MAANTKTPLLNGLLQSDLDASNFQIKNLDVSNLPIVSVPLPYVVGDIIVASSTSALSRLPDAVVGNVLLSGGVGVAPTFGKVTADNSTGLEATANKGAVSGYASLDTNTKVPIAQIPTGTTGSSVAIGNDTRLFDNRPANSIVTATNHFISSANDPTNGQALAYNSTTLQWEPKSLTGTGAVSSDAIWTAKGDLAAGTGASTAQKLTAGTNDQVLVYDSTTATGLEASFIIDANIDPAAAIAESKLALVSDAAAGTASRRSLGTTSVTAAAGNDSRFSSPTLTLTNSDYTFVLADNGNEFLHDEATARTWTIPSNASVAYPIGAVMNGYNNAAAGTLTIAITTDTLRRGDGTAGTGSRTVGANCGFTLKKIKATEWMIFGRFS